MCAKPCARGDEDEVCCLPSGAARAPREEEAAFRFCRISESWVVTGALVCGTLRSVRVWEGFLEERMTESSLAEGPQAE